MANINFPRGFIPIGGCNSVFHFKKLCYDSSFAIPGYVLDDKFKNMMTPNNIKCVYLLEHEKMDDDGAGVIVPVGGYPVVVCGWCSTDSGSVAGTDVGAGPC